MSHGQLRCAKMATVEKKGTELTVEKSLPLCIFQYNEKPIMSVEEMSEVKV